MPWVTVDYGCGWCTGCNSGKRLRCEGCEGCSEIVRRVASLPLDVAANTPLLIRRHRRSCQHGVGGGADVATGHGHRRVRAGTALVEAAAVDECPLIVEQIQVRRARSAEALRHVL